MQKLWAMALAGEANSPRKYSKRTVNLFSSLDKDDAQRFSRLCSYGFVIQGDLVTLIYDIFHPIYKNHGINFSILSHLEGIGLIQLGDVSDFVLRNLHQKINVIFFGKKVQIEFQSPTENHMEVGCVLLTQVGNELATICDSVQREGFLEYVKEKWTSFGYKIE